MRRKTIIYCEECGSERPGGVGFVVFHGLAFCSPDCREVYREADELRSAQRDRRVSAA